MSGDILISCYALSKIVLHAAKYPHFSVNGVVLAASQNEHSASELDVVTQNEDSDSDVVIVDAIPLFHHQLMLAPMLEVALTQIEHVYKEKGYTIAGYYQANEHLKDNVPDFVALKVAEKITENNNNACLIMLDNRKMSLNLDSIPFIVSHLSSDGKWKNKEKACVRVDSSTLSVASQLLQRRVQSEIYDFDNHLDDLSCDWANLHINRLINSILSIDEEE